MEATKRSTPKLEEARRRWGLAVVVVQDDRTGLAITFGTRRVPRVTEQIRDISQHKLDRSPTR